MHLIHGRLPIRELDACQPGSRNDRLRKGRVQNCRTRKVVLQYAEMMYVSGYRPIAAVHLTLLARTSNSSNNLQHSLDPMWKDAKLRARHKGQV